MLARATNGYANIARVGILDDESILERSRGSGLDDDLEDEVLKGYLRPAVALYGESILPDPMNPHSLQAPGVPP